jgi:ketosteroid isomerase-like protein
MPDCRDTRPVMSQQNVERILRGYEALNRGDVDGAVQGISPDCEVTLPHILLEADVHQGREGLRSFWQGWHDTFEEFRMEIEEVIDAGDRVVVMAAACGTGRDSGAEVRTPTFAIVWTIRGDQAIRMQAMPTRAAALEAVGHGA